MKIKGVRLRSGLKTSMLSFPISTFPISSFPPLPQYNPNQFNHRSRRQRGYFRDRRTSVFIRAIRGKKFRVRFRVFRVFRGQSSDRFHHGSHGYDPDNKPRPVVLNPIHSPSTPNPW